MDKLTEAKMIAAFERVAKKANEVYEERWLTAKQMAEYVGVLTDRWLEDHGDLLPRTRFEWEENGVKRSGSWIYPLHRIQAMIADGRIKSLKKIY